MTPSPEAQEKENPQPPARRQFFNFLFLKLDSGFRALLSNEKIVAKQEFSSALESASKKLAIQAYSLQGLRADCDFLLWRTVDDLALLQENSRKILSSGVGKHLTPVYSYISIPHPAAAPAAQEGKAGNSPVSISPGQPALLVCPFTLGRRWRRLPRTEREKMTGELLAIKNEYSSAGFAATFSIGIDGGNFLLTAETDCSERVFVMLQNLREAAIGRTCGIEPAAFLCLRGDAHNLVGSLG
ncbi:MAG: hypothetical protein A3G41_08435 [Elusimicrobia bacterium RIFCSPLOWO2_12_FULL_59_9]|nr:MAG: hypothetical protein A3G41_08435 [Elusimicrobia bacterium RIFCSPLOWO2_12_FULL_59_9]